MERDWRDDLREQMAKTKRWIDDRTADVSHNLGDLEARGRQIYGDGIRTGVNVLARTTRELQDVGRALPDGEGLQGPFVNAAVPVAKTRGRTRVVLTEPKASARASRAPIDTSLGRQSQAALSGGVDEFTMGTADPVLAAGDALYHGGLDGYGDRYASNMATKRVDDAYDAEHYGPARTTGRIAGLAASVAVMGAPAVERSLVRALPGGAKLVGRLGPSRYGLDPRALNVMAAAGGAGAGVVSQAASDVLTHHDSSLADYLAAGGGGAVDGLATLRFGPAAGAAFGGGATTGAQDVIDGRGLSADRVLDSGHTAAVMGQLGGLAGTYATSALPNRLKGQLGEMVSNVKTFARGDGLPVNVRKRVPLKGGGYTIADQTFRPSYDPSRLGIVESKVGPYASLTPRQRQARAQFGPDYVIDGYRYSDFGKMTGAAISPFGDQLADRGGPGWSAP